MQPTIQTTNHPLADLLARQHPGNPKEHDIAGVMESIELRGFTSPPTLDGRSGVLAVGHGRLLALSQLKLAGKPPPRRIVVDEETGEWLVPTLTVDFADDEERDAYVIADNKLTEAGGWDESKLAALLRKFGKPVSLSSMGFTRDAYDSLMKRFSTSEPGALTQEQLEAMDTGLRIYRDEEIVDAAFEHYTAAGFPFPDPTKHEALLSLNRLASLPLKALIRTTVGYDLADKFQRHRFEASAEGMRAPMLSYKTEKYRRIAIENIVKLGGTLSDASVRSSLCMVRATQACANFRPGFAAYMYRRFCPIGGVALDTSTGYGGRLVGALASTTVKRYIGIDPNAPTVAGNRELLAWLGRETFATLIEQPAEDVDAAPIASSCDFAFTSPPYFRKEHYSDDDTQSWKRYPTAEGWQRGFLAPMMALQFAALKRGAIAAVNIADVVVDGERHPLGNWTCSAAREVGFELVERLDFPMTRRFGAHQKDEVASEPVYIFRKP